MNLNRLKRYVGSTFNFNKRINRRSVIKITVSVIIVFILFQALSQIKFINIIQIDWYLRYNYPRLYSFLSRNILHILSFCITLCLSFFTYYGFEYNWRVCLLPSHVILLIGIKIIMVEWYKSLIKVYLIVGITDVFIKFVPPKSKKIFQKFKILTTVLFLSYYFIWNFYNIEPLTHFVKTPDFVPEPLCSNQEYNLTYFNDAINKWMEDIHNKMLSSEIPVKDKRILVYRTSVGGLGNRLVGLISSFLLAVLLERAFFIDWISSKDELYAPLDELFWNDKFSWKLINLFNSERWYFGTTELLWDYVDTQAEWIPYCRLCPFRNYINKDDIYNKMLCDKHGGFEHNQTFIVVRSTQWFAPVLAHNPHFRNKICKLTGPDIFGTLSKFLLQPTNLIQQRIDELKTEFKTSDRVIGLQIRQIEGNGISDDQLDVFLRCAKTLSIGAKQPKYFISTDNEKTRNHVTSLLGEQNVILNDKEIDRTSINGIQNALIDMWLLGETNEVIVSPYSSFGDVAYSRVSKVPHRVTRNNLCVKMLSSQPCFQYWFGVTMSPCFNKTMLSIDMMNQEDCWL